MQASDSWEGVRAPGNAPAFREGFARWVSGPGHPAAVPADPGRQRGTVWPPVNTPLGLTGAAFVGWWLSQALVGSDKCFVCPGEAGGGQNWKAALAL